MGAAIAFELRPVHGSAALDPEVARRIGAIAQADAVERTAAGDAVLRFAAGRDAATVRGYVEIAARMELGAHWHTRYELVDG